VIEDAMDLVNSEERAPNLVVDRRRLHSDFSHAAHA
jgi:hypothetical protein